MAPKSKKQKVSSAEKNDQLDAIQSAKPQQIVAELLDNEEYGRTYTSELNIQLQDGDDSSLFQWLCCSILFSSGLSEALTMRACKVLLQEGLLDSIQATKAAATEKFVGALDHKYQRKEQTAKYIHSAASVLLDKYEGSLFKLREEASRNPDQIKAKLKEIKGLAEVGTNIFFREAQLVWDELVPFIDKRAAEAAVQMGLPDSADELLKLVDGNVGKLATLAAALVRVSLSKDKGIEDIAEGVQAGQAGASDAQKDRE